MRLTNIIWESPPNTYEYPHNTAAANNVLAHFNATWLVFESYMGKMKRIQAHISNITRIYLFRNYGILIQSPQRFLGMHVHIHYLPHILCMSRNHPHSFHKPKPSYVSLMTFCDMTCPPLVEFVAYLTYASLYSTYIFLMSCISLTMRTYLEYSIFICWTYLHYYNAI